MTDPGNSASHPNSVGRFFGGALIVVGAMIMLLCGGCGAAFLVFFLAEALKATNAGGDLVGAILTPLLMGGIPAMAGLGLVVVGRALWRGPRP